MHGYLLYLFSFCPLPNCCEAANATYNQADKLYICTKRIPPLFFLQVNLGSNQYLFSTVVDPKEMPCFCLRHDVDALLWQPRPDQPDKWEHISTFNALGMGGRLFEIAFLFLIKLWSITLPTLPCSISDLIHNRALCLSKLG